MKEKHSWLYDLLFILVLLLAGYLRLSGADWGEGMHQHPDELFMTSVLSNLRAHTCVVSEIPVDACPPDKQRWMNPLDYFNSGTSTLNPYNRGNASYVYGDLPLTIIRIAVELTNNEDLGNIKFFARQFSALADLLTIFLLYLIISNLYGRRIALFASTFSAFAVMQIQQSHFFTVDLFVNLFMFLTLYFAVEIITQKAERRAEAEGGRRGRGRNSKSAFCISHSAQSLLLAQHLLRYCPGHGDGVKDQCRGYGALIAGRIHCPLSCA